MANFFGSLGRGIGDLAEGAVQASPYVAQVVAQRKAKQDADRMKATQAQYAKNADDRASQALGLSVQKQNDQTQLVKAQIEKMQQAPAFKPEPNSVVVGPDGTRTYVPRSQAAGMTAPSPRAPQEPGVFVGDPQHPDAPAVYKPRKEAFGGTKPAAPIGGASGGSGGMGSGGIGGLARTSGAITEMDQAHQNMLPFEESVRTGKANYNGVDYFQGQMAKMYDAHGKIDQVIHAATFSNLNKTNPDLANYLRNAEAWALADGALSGRTSDFRTRMDAFVSAIGPNPGQSHIDQTQRMRGTRLEEIKKFQPAMQAMAAKVTGSSAPRGRGGPPPNVDHPPNTNDTPGPPNIGGSAPSTVSPLRVKYDAAVAHLKAQRKTDAEIAKVLGPPPNEEE